jgi:SagB-type dehydrogenase family enzyme
MTRSISITTAAGRHFLTDRIRQEVDFRNTAQSRGQEPPAPQKTPPPGVETIVLPGVHTLNIPPFDLATAIGCRESRRQYLDAPLSLEELSFLLWVTQGVRSVQHRAAILRTVPSAGCRHPLETYLAIQRVTGLESGIYRYLPLDHALVCEKRLSSADLSARLVAATHGQRFAGKAALTFIWTTLPVRTEWRYGQASYKVIALDAGHVCQNLYLACEAIDAGTCAIAAYDQELMDDLLGVDGYDEFVIYLAPVGKVR